MYRYAEDRAKFRAGVGKRKVAQSRMDIIMAAFEKEDQRYGPALPSVM